MVGNEGKVDFNTLRRIINSTDPREAVGKVIKELHQYLAKIQEQIKKADFEKKIKLSKIEDKLKDAINALQRNDLETALAGLNEIKTADPLAFAQIQPQVDKILKLTDQAHKIRMQSVGITAGPGTIA